MQAIILPFSLFHRLKHLLRHANQRLNLNYQILMSPRELVLPSLRNDALPDPLESPLVVGTYLAVGLLDPPGDHLLIPPDVVLRETPRETVLAVQTRVEVVREGGARVGEGKGRVWDWETLIDRDQVGATVA